MFKSAYDLPTTAGSNEIEITKDFTTEQKRFEDAFDFAIRNSGIQTVKPRDYTVKYLLENHYSNIVLYHKPSSRGSSSAASWRSIGTPAGKGSVATRLGMGHSSLTPSFMASPGMGKTSTTTKKVSRAPPGLGSRAPPGLGSRAPPGLGSRAPPGLGSVASKTKKASTAPIYEGVVFSCCTKTKAGSNEGEIKRNDNEEIIPFTGTFEEGTNVKFKIRSIINRAYDVEIKSSPIVKGKSKKLKRRKSKKEKTKKK